MLFSIFIYIEFLKINALDMNPGRYAFRSVSWTLTPHGLWQIMQFCKVGIIKIMYLKELL